MGEISDDQVEWAVVHRLKAMLDEPPKTEFNVTQAFAHFTAIVVWTTQRIRVRDAVGAADQAAQQALQNLQARAICAAPWSLSRQPPVPEGADILSDAQDINADFEGMTVDQFTIWLRNALAHGDGRSIKPIHKKSRRTTKEYLGGFEISGVQGKTLHLYHHDMIRIGKALAQNFCQALSRIDAGFEAEVMSDLLEPAA